MWEGRPWGHTQGGGGAGNGRGREALQRQGSTGCIAPLPQRSCGPRLGCWPQEGHVKTLQRASAPECPAASHHQPTPPPEIPGHSRASLGQSLVGSLLLPLGPGAHKFLFVSSKSLFPLSCVNSGASMVGLMMTSSKRAYAIPKSAAPRAPAPEAVHR